MEELDRQNRAFEKRIKRQIIGKPHRFLAIAPLGFEQTLAREIEFCNPQVVGDGKVEFTAKITEAWKAVAYTRVANRIMMHIADFKAENFRDLEKKASEIPWELYLHHTVAPAPRHTEAPHPRHTEALRSKASVSIEQCTDSLAPAGLRNDNQTEEPQIHIHVTCKHSRLYHSDAVAERLYKVIEGGSLPLASATRHPRPFDMLRAGSGGDLPVSSTPPSAGGQHLGACSLVRMATKVGTPRNAPPQNLYVTLIDDRCTLWLDLAGEELYKRGHERFVNDAPLKETIAAAMLFEAIEFATAPSLDPSTTPSRASLRMTQCCLLDLMSGSGTFSLEAAYMASGLIPGKCRDFALKHQPAFKPATWKHIVSSMDSLAPTGLRNDNKKKQVPTDVTPKRDATIVTPKPEAQVCPIAKIITSDISERAVNIIRHNVECSPGVQVNPQLRDFFTYTAKEIADACCARNNASIPATRDKDKHAASDNDTQPVIVLNPPYGKRLDFNAPALYTRIGKKLAELARELEPFGKKLTVAILAPNDDPRPGSKFTCTANLLRECPALDPQRNPSARRIATSHGGLGLGAFIAQI